MLARLAEAALEERLRRYPAAALVGPRQSGKTTLARSLDGRYFDLEQEGDRLRLDLEWSALVGSDRLVILDEAQVWPELFPRLRGAIDADRKRFGRFLLLGSVSPRLMTEVSESLAGRLALLELSPLLLPELDPLEERGLVDLWLHGGYPDGGILSPEQYPRWQLDYLTLLSQRDLPAWGFPARPQVGDRLIRMIAAVHGQTWNASQIGQSLGLSYATVNSYVDYLEGAFLVRRLRPYQANIRKRLVKRPKIYWRDSGLLHALHRVASLEDLLGRPWVGASWEGFVIEQILGTLAATDAVVEPFYFRTSDGYELDLLLDFGPQRWGLEVKLTSAPTTADLQRLKKTAQMAGLTHAFLISQADDVIEGEHVTSATLPWMLQRVRER